MFNLTNITVEGNNTFAIVNGTVQKSSALPTVIVVSVEDVVLNVLTVLFGSWAALSNGMLLTIYLTSAHLKNDKHLLQFGLFIAEFIFGLGAFIAATDRLRIIFSPDSWFTAYYCLLISGGIFFGDIFSLCIVCSMALERLFAISMPVIYRNMNRNRFAGLLILSSFSMALLSFGMCFYGVDNKVKPSACTGSGARLAALKPLLSYLNCAIGCLIVALYFLLLIIVKYKTKKFKKITMGNNVDAENTMKKEVKAIKFLSFIVLTSSMLLIVPNVILTILTAQGVSSASKVGPYTTLLSVCYSAVNIFIFLWKNKKIRHAFKNIKQGFMQRQAVVTSMYPTSIDVRERRSTFINENQNSFRGNSTAAF